MPGWAVEIDYAAPETAGLVEVGLIFAEYDPPGPGQARFRIFRLMRRDDIQDPASGPFTEFIDEAIARLSKWTESQNWSDADAPAVEAALDAATP